MSEIQDKQKELLEELEGFFDWDEKFEFICDLGKSVGSDFPEDKKRDEFLVRGCTSKVWLVPEMRDGRLHFLADSDSIFVRGLVALVLRVYNDQKPEHIEETSPEFLKEAGLLQNLTPNRANGVASMIQMIQQYAKSCRQSEESSGD